LEEFLHWWTMSNGVGEALQATIKTFFKWNLLYMVSLLQYVLKPNEFVRELGTPGATVRILSSGFRDGNKFSRILYIFKSSPRLKDTLVRFDSNGSPYFQFYYSE
jgi:hypothetical protein